MDETTNKKIKNSDCPCDSPGYCVEYGVHMSEHLYNKCVNQPTWRSQFESIIGYSEEPSESVEERQRQHREHKAMKSHEEQLDEVVTALEQEGVSLENYQEKKEGLGDVIGNIFTKLGVTEETVEKWSGIGGCGCQKRKKFLNTILPFRNKE